MTARRLAVRALMHQEKAGYANLVWDAELKKCDPPLPARDAAFAARIFYTVTERQNLLDYALQKFLAKPLSRLDAPVRAVLRAGLGQAWYMDVPARAAVNESVRLTRELGKASAAGLVNAVLRRVVELPVKESDFTDEEERLEIYYCLSRPIAELLYKQYAEEAFLLAASFFERPPTTIAVNTLRTSAAALIARLRTEGCAVSAAPLPDMLQAEFRASPAASAAFAEGLFHVQGLASRLAALCLEAAPGQRVLDLCAAPGGKSITLAQQMQNTGELLAGELVPARVGLLQKAFERCGVTCAEALQNDALVPRPEWGRFDRVLCDVPCSGLGVIAKKPDIRRKDLCGMEKLLRNQQKILQNGADMLAENGRLVYSTCTVNYAENAAQIKHFLQKNANFRTVTPKIVPNGAEIDEYGMLLLPHKTGTDGFFIAVLEKIS